MSPEAVQSALKQTSSPGIEPIRGTGLLKAVTIDDNPEEIPPGFSAKSVTNSPTLGPTIPKQHRASMTGKKLSGRPSLNKNPSFLPLSNQFSNFGLDGLPDRGSKDADMPDQDPRKVLSQVLNWLSEEKAALSASSSSVQKAITNYVASEDDSEPGSRSGHRHNRPKQRLALERLERILAGYTSNIGDGASANRPLRRKGSVAKKGRRPSVPASSDTEYQDGDINVPNVEAVLDNCKTMQIAGPTDNDLTTVKAKDRERWDAFKNDVVRLTHTLRLKGWRQVPLHYGQDIDVRRLSGALTNAVYVVSPPKNLEQTGSGTDSKNEVAKTDRPKRRPAKLLLRIYGPQVEHLIDRNGELAILRRLARKHIGPRMLGTFTNGRFEEFFHAKTLTPEDLRVAETSKQIAKRMRELHEGIELLPEEREAGPFVWINWDKWVGRCEQVTTWLDKQILLMETEGSNVQPPKRWMRRGFVCGVQWPLFRRTVEKYRKQIEKTHGGASKLKEQLVFAHNDTQYGNLLRLIPSGESPLLLPSNTHRQLVVIDFEYASANPPGMEFANHFTEWCYNYHHPTQPYVCNTAAYPTPQEQHRFIRSYVMHRPQYNPSASATPKLAAKDGSIEAFMLDSRGASQQTQDYAAEETAREEAAEVDIQHLLRETQMWRLANSAQWVAWGIVQAKVPELDNMPKGSKTAAILDKIKTSVQDKLNSQSDPVDTEVKALQPDAKADRPEGSLQEAEHDKVEAEEEDHEDFDYLTYAQDRAMFFWGDALQMGLVAEEELPEGMRQHIKFVKY